jgi:hypothetical protein
MGRRWLRLQAEQQILDSCEGPFTGRRWLRLQAEQQMLSCSCVHSVQQSSWVAMEGAPPPPQKRLRQCDAAARENGARAWAARDSCEGPARDDAGCASKRNNRFLTLAKDRSRDDAGCASKRNNRFLTLAKDRSRDDAGCASKRNNRFFSVHSVRQTLPRLQRSTEFLGWDGRSAAAATETPPAMRCGGAGERSEGLGCVLGITMDPPLIHREPSVKERWKTP